jgi:predicted nucleotidyltransferase
MSDHTTLLSPLVEEIASRIPEAPPDARPGRAQLAAVVASIAERFRPERIVLFGSRAYGTPTFDSDVDLMVVMETDLPNPEQAFRIHSTLELVPSFALDILVRRPEQIALGLAEGDFFIHDVMRKGIVLYDDGRRIWEMSAPGTPPPAGAGGVTQAAEKILKGFLQQHLIPFPRTHNLEDLANLAMPVLPGVQPQLADLQWLTNFAVDIRYPGATATAADIARAIQIADDVRTLVRTALGLPTT